METEKGEGISVSFDTLSEALTAMREVFPDAILRGKADGVTAYNGDFAVAFIKRANWRAS